MAKIQFLTILLLVTCFLGDVLSVTDSEFKVSNVFMKILLREFIKCTSKISFVGSNFQALSASVVRQGRLLDDQLLINQQLRDENEKQDALIKYLLDQVQHLTGNAMAIGKEVELTEGKISLDV